MEALRWCGKARPGVAAGFGWHPLPYHMLDVAGVALRVLEVRPGLGRRIAGLSGMEVEQVAPWVGFMVALHDLGKFDLSFQAMAPQVAAANLGLRHVPLAACRHDLGGVYAWAELLRQPEGGGLPLVQDGQPITNPRRVESLLRPWILATCGHHGRPPQETGRPPVWDYATLAAAAELMKALAALFRLPRLVGGPSLPATLRSSSWLLAGLTALSDWVGSQPHDDGGFPPIVGAEFPQLADNRRDRSSVRRLQRLNSNHPLGEHPGAPRGARRRGRLWLSPLSPPRDAPRRCAKSVPDSERAAPDDYGLGGPLPRACRSRMIRPHPARAPGIDSPHKALVDLLVALFDEGELRRFLEEQVRLRQGDLRLHHPAGVRALADDAVQRFADRRWLDGAFFDALVARREDRAQDIARIAALFGSPPQTIDIFIAHAGPDEARARELHAELKKHGIAPFVDVIDLLPGDDGDQVLSLAQRRARVTAILVGPTYDRAFYLRDEVATAIALARADASTHRAVPVYLDGRPSNLDTVPYGLRVKNALDWPASGGASGVAGELARVLGACTALWVPVQRPRSPDELLRDVRYDVLLRLLPPQLGELVRRTEAPPSEFPPASEPPETRALSVVQWLDGQSVETRLRFDRLLKQFVPWRFPGPGDAPATDPQEWLRHLLDRHAHIRVLGLRTGDARYEMDLDELFVDVDIVHEGTAHERCLDHAGFEAPRSDPLDEARSLPAALAAVAAQRVRYGYRGIVLVGLPGSGKTTLLQRRFLDDTRDPDAPRPLLLRFSTLQRIGTQELGARSLAAWAEREAELDGFAGAGRSLLSNPGARIRFLLDGYDELQSRADRARVAAWLAQEVGRWQNADFVLTTRKAAWDTDDHSALLGCFASYVLLGLTTQTIDERARTGRQPRRPKPGWST